MITRMLMIGCVILMGGAIGLAQEADAPQAGTSLTVYNQDFAVVKEVRRMTLAAGRSEVRFADVASGIDPTSVQFASLSDPGGTSVVEQNYEFDLVNAGKLLQKYVDHPIAVVLRDGTLAEGTLMSWDGGQLVLATDRGIEMVPRGENVRDIRFASLPAGLLLKPTLLWHVQAVRAGEHLVKVAYQTRGMTWRVDYTAIADADGKTLDLAGWVTATNNSGATYTDAQLKLMAGDVHIVREPVGRPRSAARPEDRSGGRLNKGAGFEEKSFAEYHLYTLGRRTTLKDRQTKQIELLVVERIPVTRKYVYRGGRNVDVVLEFKNDKTLREGLGVPLPKGPIRVYQTDADRQQEFVGRDEIDHTPKDEEVKIRIGTAFEIVGERTQLNQRRPSPRTAIQDWRVRLRNHKNEPVRVEVVETLQGRWNWRITAKSQDYRKKDFRTIAFDVDVPANAEHVVTYTVHYDW